jgi:hypothetical protein
MFHDENIHNLYFNIWKYIEDYYILKCIYTKSNQVLVQTEFNSFVTRPNGLFGEQHLISKK